MSASDMGAAHPSFLLCLQDMASAFFVSSYFDHKNVPVMTPPPKQRVSS